MLVYNNMGAPHDLNIFYNRNEEFPYTLESGNDSIKFRTLEEVLSHLETSGFASVIGAKMIREKIQVKVSGCQYFPGRKCRGCPYSSDPKLFDGCCLYGHDEELRLVDDCLG